MAPKNTEAEKLHLRLEALWRLLKAGDFQEAKIHVDYMTWKSIMGRQTAFMDQSVTGKGNTWRDIAVVIHAARLPVFVSDSVPPDPWGAHREPFCMYIEAVKRNGRRVYFDDGETDERFL